MAEFDLLAEISDDPDDHHTDYGRGYRAGWKAAGLRIAADLERMKTAQKVAGVFLAALAYDGAAELARLTAGEHDDDGDDDEL